MELALKTPCYGSAVSSTSEDNAKKLSLTVNHGLEILFLQKGTKYFNALMRVREFQLKYSAFIHSNHKTININEIEIESLSKLLKLRFAELFSIKNNRIYFRNETRLLKEKLLKVNYLNDFSLNENGFDQSHYCYMNSREYKITKKLSESKLKALAWANILTQAPKGSSQKTLAKYLKVSNATVNHWAKEKVYHLSTPQKIKLGSIKRTYKQLIREKFQEIKYKKDSHSKVIMKKSKDQLKIELWAILSNKYDSRANHKKTIKWSKNKTFKFSLINFVQENGTSRLFSNRAKQSLKKKERRQEASYSKWVNNRVEVNLDFITIKKGDKSFQKLWKYKTLSRTPIVLKNTMNELKRNDLFRINEILSRKNLSSSKLARNNNWFFWQTMMFKPRLQKGAY